MQHTATCQEDKRPLPPDDAAPWDRNATRIGQVGPKRLESALMHAAPHIFTAPNLKSLKSRGQKYMGARKLMAYIEYGANWDANTQIPFEYRDEEEFLSWFSDCVKQLGDRFDGMLLEKETEDQFRGKKGLSSNESISPPMSDTFLLLVSAGLYTRVFVSRSI